MEHCREVASIFIGKRDISPVEAISQLGQSGPGALSGDIFEFLIVPLLRVRSASGI